MTFSLAAVKVSSWWHRFLHKVSQSRVFCKKIASSEFEINLAPNTKKRLQRKIAFLFSIINELKECQSLPLKDIEGIEDLWNRACHEWIEVFHNGSKDMDSLVVVEQSIDNVLRNLEFSNSRKKILCI